MHVSGEPFYKIERRQKLLEENEPGDEPEHKELEHLLDRIKDRKNGIIRNQNKVIEMDVDILDLEVRLENLKKRKEKAKETIQTDNSLVKIKYYKNDDTSTTPHRSAVQPLPPSPTDLAVQLLGGCQNHKRSNNLLNYRSHFFSL